MDQNQRPHIKLVSKKRHGLNFNWMKNRLCTLYREFIKEDFAQSGFFIS